MSPIDFLKNENSYSGKIGPAALAIQWGIVDFMRATLVSAFLSVPYSGEPTHAEDVKLVDGSHTLEVVTYNDTVSFPNWQNDPNIETVDINNDGQDDIVLYEKDVLLWTSPGNYTGMANNYDKKTCEQVAFYLKDKWEEKR